MKCWNLFKSKRNSLGRETEEREKGKRETERGEKEKEREKRKRKKRANNIIGLVSINKKHTYCLMLP